MQPHAAPCSPDTAARHPAAEPWRTAHLGPRPSAPSWPCSCVRQLGEDEDGLAYEIAIEQELGYLKGVGATFDAKAKVGRGPQPHPSSSVHPGPSRLYRARELVYARLCPLFCCASLVHLHCAQHSTTQHSTAQHSTAQLSTLSTLRTCCAGTCLGDVEGERGGHRARARDVCCGASASGNRWQRACGAGRVRGACRL